MSPSPAPAFSVTEMLTTAGVTFLTSGAKAKPKPTLVARAAARTRRNGDIAFGREIWESMLKPLRRGCGGVNVKRHAGRLGARGRRITQRGLRRAFPGIKSV